MAKPEVGPYLCLLTERTVREFAHTKHNSAGFSNLALRALQLKSASASRASPVPQLLALPSAVLRRILSELYIPDLFNVCCICRHLRQMALDDPSLWTGVQIFQLEGSAWPAMVRRSGSLPLDLYLSCRGVITSPVLERLAFLADHLHRLERLQIQIVDPLQEPSNSISHFFATLTNPAPILIQLLIFYDDLGYVFKRPTVHFPPDFLGDTSALKTFGAVNTLLDPRISQCLAFSNLEEFSWWLPDRATLSLNRLAEILGSLSCLQRLGIYAYNVESYNGLQPLARKVPVAYAAWPQGQGDLLQHFLLDVLGVQDLRLWTHNMPPTVIPLADACSLYATLRYCDIGLPDGRRVLLTLTGWMGDCFSHISQEAWLFNSLRELCLDQCVWSEYAPFPLAPRLESLTFLLSGYYHLWGYFSECFCFSLQPLLGGPWHCESLRELRFTTTSPCTVSFGELAHFVSKSISFGSPRLRRLSICGIAHVCDIDLAGALDSLRELADDVHLSAYGTARVEPEYILEWNAKQGGWAQDSFTFQMGSFGFRLCM